MGSQVKLVLLASSFGQTMATEIRKRGLAINLLSGTAGGNESHVCRGLMPVGGEPLLNWWLRAMKTVPRLLPIQDKVFIVTNALNHDDITTWASQPQMSMGGFPLANIVCTGHTSSKNSHGMLHDLAFAIQALQLGQDHLVVAELDAIFEPKFSLQRIVEHAMVRAKDTITYSLLPPGEDLTHHCSVIFEDPDSVNPKVLSVDANTQGHKADGFHTTVIAPVYVFRKSTIPDILEASSSSSPLPAFKQFGQFLQKLCQMKPVYALPVDVYLTLRTLDHYLFANSFYMYYYKATTEKDKRGQAQQALEQVKTLGIATGTILRTPLEKDFDALLEVSSEAKQLLVRFQEQYEGPEALEGGTARPMPLRFADVTTRRHNPRQQHPVYTTSNATYGGKPASQIDMPNSYFGSNGAFTNSFPGPVRVSSLVTATTRSKVHKALDDF